MRHSQYMLHRGPLVDLLFLPQGFLEKRLEGPGKLQYFQGGNPPEFCTPVATPKGDIKIVTMGQRNYRNVNIKFSLHLDNQQLCTINYVN